MLRVYAAWADGSVESDVDAIRRSMNRHARLKPAAKCGTSAAALLRSHRAARPVARCAKQTSGSRRRLEILAVDLPVRTTGKKPKYRKAKGFIWRTERDSNPRRAFDPYTLSRGAPSTTRPSVRPGPESASTSVTCKRPQALPQLGAAGGHDTKGPRGNVKREGMRSGPRAPEHCAKAAAVSR